MTFDDWKREATGLEDVTEGDMHVPRSKRRIAELEAEVERLHLTSDEWNALRLTIQIIRGCESADDSMSGVRQGHALSDRLAALVARLSPTTTQEDHRG